MKILQVNPYPPQHLGGSEIFCRNLAINLSREPNISTDILTSDIFKKKIKKSYLNKRIKVFYKKFHHNLWGVNPLVNIIPFLKKNYQNYDIIHSHSYIFLTSLQSTIFRKFRKFPHILHLHGGIETPASMGNSWKEYFQLIFKDYLFDKTVGKFIFNNSDKIISVSKSDLSRIQKLYNIPKEKCHYVPNGVNTKKFQNKPDIEKKYITFIGRLTYIKGFDVFLELVKKIHHKDKNLEFLIIGDGPLEKLLIHNQDSIPITYFPNFPYSKMEDVYNMSKILVMTSRFEGLPTTLLESLSCETPVLTSNVGGISELIQTNRNGFFINIEENNNTAEKILDLVSDDDKIRKMGQKGRSIIENDFSWKIISKKIIKIYEEVLS